MQNAFMSQKVFLPEEFKDLCTRMRTLKEYTVVDSLDALALSLMWEKLAEDFSGQKHPINSDMCQRKADYWKNQHISMKQKEPFVEPDLLAEDPTVETGEIRDVSEAETTETTEITDADLWG